MTNPSKRKGTAWETACTVYLRRAYQDDEGCIHRAPLHGSKDEGDIHGLRINGEKAIIECKNAKNYEFGTWVDQAVEEAWNADAEYGVVFVKRRGLGIEHVGQHWALMDIDTFIRMNGGEIPE